MFSSSLTKQKQGTAVTSSSHFHNDQSYVFHYLCEPPSGMLIQVFTNEAITSPYPRL